MRTINRNTSNARSVALNGAALAAMVALPPGIALWVAVGPTALVIACLCLSPILGAAAGVILDRRQRQQESADEGRSLALLASVQRVAQLGIAERSLRTGQSVWSDEFHAILGVVPGKVRPSLAVFLDCVHPSDRAAVEAALELVVKEGRRLERNFRIIRPDGEIRIINGRSEVGLDAAGTPIRLDSIIQDVTERKRLEDELDGLIRELWRSNEELEQFAYVASHDLRQPLRVVGSYVSLLEEELQGSLNGEALEYMAFVRDGVRRMDRLINDLLTYSRVGRIATDEQVSLERALASATADLQFEIEEAGARVRADGELPVVMGDQSEMERLFLNLIGNAVKYRSPERAPEIVVACEDLEDAWRISVTDNGIGIPAEHAERVFGIFQRLHARDEFEGTGVGLAIVKKIVERHGGGIRVEADRTDGTRITFTWPKTRVASELSV